VQAEKLFQSRKNLEKDIMVLILPTRMVIGLMSFIWTVFKVYTKKTTTLFFPIYFFSLHEEIANSNFSSSNVNRLQLSSYRVQTVSLRLDRIAAANIRWQLHNNFEKRDKPVHRIDLFILKWQESDFSFSYWNDSGMLNYFPVTVHVLHIVNQDKLEEHYYATQNIATSPRPDVSGN
jgi:hypothetical protein